MKQDKTRVFNMDCMEYMKDIPDKYFELAIVDPPYGIENKISIGGGSHTKSKSKFHQRYKENGKKWDVRPNDLYWKCIFRITKNQIVFGANYFTEFLPVSRGWVFWDKQGENMTSVNNELIFTSFDISIKTFSRCHGMDKGFLSDHKVFHPTTKPVKLYEWLLMNYAKEGDKILDTHLGSGSSRIAAFNLGFDFTGIELDQEYFDASCKRFENHKKQLTLF